MGRERTRFTGVYQRQHKTRRHLGKPDICYDITYKTPDGKKVWEKVGWTSEHYTAQLASQVRAERMRVQRHGDLPHVARKKSMTFAQGFESYRKDWLHQIKTAQEDIRRYHAYLEPQLGERSLDAIGALDLERLKSHMTRQGYSPQTIKHALGLVRRVYRKLISWEMYQGKPPTDAVIMPRVDASRTRYLTEEEADQLLQALCKRAPDWHNIALLSLNTGMRLGEILALRWEDVNFKDAHIVIRDAKSGSRTAILNDEASRMLRKIDPQFTGLVFPAKGTVEGISARVSHTFIRVVRELGFNAGLIDSRQKVVFHTLRHTFASWLAIKGVPLYVIGELLGHKTLEMTKRYSHLCPDAKKDAVAVIDGIMKARERGEGATHHGTSSDKPGDTAR